jgi:hypothetical protein
MPGIIYFIFFLGCGWAVAARFFRQEVFLARLAVGMSLGLTGMMWAGVPFFILFGFTPWSQALGAGLAGIVTLLAVSKAPGARTGEVPERLPRALYVLVALIVLLISAMFFCHVILSRDGGLNTGPGTYGDLPLHMGIMSNLLQSGNFPPDNIFFSGTKLHGYHMLANSLSASLVQLGLSMRWAVLLPSFCFTFVLAAGFVMLSREVLGTVRGVFVAAGLFFLNGGLAFIYFFNPATFQLGHLGHILRGEWPPGSESSVYIPIGNVIGYILVPQRASLAGWAGLFLVLWILYRAMAKERYRYAWVAGVIGGSLPMVHAPSFFILMATAVVWAVVYYFPAQDRQRHIRYVLTFSGVALAIMLPQMLGWLAPVAAKSNYIRFAINGINDHDPWIWFWLKNVGVVFALSAPAFWYADAARRRFYSAAIVIFLAAESFLLAPQPFDNNKFFYIWLAFSATLVAGFIVDTTGKIRRRSWKGMLAGAVLFPAVFFGVFSVILNFRTSYQVISPAELEVAAFVKAKTPPDAVFLTSDTHKNPVAMLAGRSVVCGHLSFLFNLGIDYGPRLRDMEIMYTEPDKFPALARQYNVDYVYFSSWERGSYKTGPEYFEAYYPRVFSNDEVSIYAVSTRARGMK